MDKAASQPAKPSGEPLKPHEGRHQPEAHTHARARVRVLTIARVSVQRPLYQP